MTCTISLKLLEKRMNALKKELEYNVAGDLSKLDSPVVLKINGEIDKLLVEHILLQLIMKDN